MTKEQAVQALSNCTSAQQWNAIVDKVLSANNGKVPSWWYEAVVMSGLRNQIYDSFK